MKIHIGTDHAGFELKNKLAEYLKTLGHNIVDHGAFEYNPDDDYPDFIKPVAHAVSSDPESLGIILGGSGQGEAMCANRIQGARAGEYYGGNVDIIRVFREHNDANILSIGDRYVTDAEAIAAVDVFLTTPFSNDERHIRRIAKLSYEDHSGDTA
jgi:ribose 5-phosphate isomerase B